MSIPEDLHGRRAAFHRSPHLDHIKRIPKEIIGTFMMHDLRSGINTLTFARVALDEIKRADPHRERYTSETWTEIDTYYQESRRGLDAVQISNNILKTLLACGKWVQAYERLMDILPQVEQSMSEDMFIQKGNALARTWKMFHHSTLFLYSLAAHNEQQASVSINKLERETFSLSDIVDISLNSKRELLTLGEHVPTQVTGIEALMLYNLLKNADQYALSSVALSYDNGVFRLRNDARIYPDTHNLFEPGKPGVGGNTGFGLFTMKHIFGEQAGYNLDINHEYDNQNGPPYQVEFIIQAPRQAPSLSQIRQ